MLTQVFAVQNLKTMAGGAQSHLMLCSDNRQYVVKFKNNPQGVRILANELLGSLLAVEMGLPTPIVALVELWSSMIDGCPDLTIHLGGSRCRPEPGLCFGSRYIVGPLPHFRISARGVTEMHPLLTANIENIADFAGMLVFDKWTCNTDGRQILFTLGRYPRFRVVMIDNGYCFGANAWMFPDSPLYGIFRDSAVYTTVAGIEAFEPWLSCLERDITLTKICRLAETIPSEWYGGDKNSLARLIDVLDRRRPMVRELIYKTWKALPRAFPMWKSPIGKVASAGTPGL
jgi:HipA-like protein